MKILAATILVFYSFAVVCLIKADEFKPGKGFPKTSESRPDLPLSSFINQRSLTTDWSLVVLLRGERHYILNDKANRELLSQPVAREDVVLLDDAAGSLLAWRRQNPDSKLDLFWESNPQLLDKALINTSATSGSASSSPNGDATEPPVPQASRIQANPPTLSVQSSSPKKAPEVKPTTSTPSEEPTSSTPWSVVAVLIVAATGLLWLLVKKRK